MNLKQVSFTTQQPAMPDQSEIDRKRKLAEMLRERGAAPLAPVSPNAPISPLSGMAKMLNAYSGAKKEKQLDEQEKQIKTSYQQALAKGLAAGKTPDEMIEGLSATGNPQALELATQLRMQMALAQAKASGSTPSNIQEWNTFQQMTPEQQEQFLRMKRADKVINLGNQQIIPNQLNPNAPPVASFDVGLKPGEEPSVKGQQQAAVEAAKTAAIPGQVAAQTEAQAKAIPTLAPIEAEAAAQKETATQFASNQEKFRANRPKMEASVDSARTKRDLIVKTAEEAKELITSLSTQFGAAMKSWPGSEARRLMNKLETLKGNVAFGVLEDMRNNSPTGGAVGQLSDPEREALAATLGSFDQYNDPKDLLITIDNVVQNRNDLYNRIERAYQQDLSRYEPESTQSIDDIMKLY